MLMKGFWSLLLEENMIYLIFEWIMSSLSISSKKHIKKNLKKDP